MFFHETRHHVVHYDIQNIVNFPAGFRLLVKIGEFSSKSPHDQDLLINEDIIEWPVGFKKVQFSFYIG